MESIKDIEQKLKSTPSKEWEAFFHQYEDDGRAGVIRLIEKYRRRLEALHKEQLRMEEMKYFEKKYADYSFIGGIDEVGRGPLAGPVVAACVILPKDCDLLYINDSKQLSEKKREELFPLIKEQAVAYAIGIESPAVIDECNILNATYKAMRKAISELSVTPDLLLNDAVNIPEVNIKQIPIIKGDAKSISIASASIIAKVTRDHMMMEFDKLYPEYDFAHNKGYGSAKHIEALKKFGPCPIHRKSFIGHFCN